MGDTAGKPSYGLHFLRLPELLFEGAPLGYVFGKEFEASFLATIRDGTPGDADFGGAAVLAHPLDDEAIEGHGRTQMVRQFEPLPRVRVECAEVFADQFLCRGVPQNCQQRGIRIQQLPQGVTAANAVRSVGNKRPEVYFGAPQSLLRCPQSRIEPADQRRQHNEQGQPQHR